MEGLLGGQEIREIAARIGLQPTKKLGQNFVVDANTCRRIVAIAEVEATDVALEIGPGLGSLTMALMERVRAVVAIEIDGRLAQELPITMFRHGFDAASLTIINEDALTVNSLPLSPTVLVANLPYNISVPVLLNMLEKFPTLRAGVVMVQREVADRLVAQPNTKTYGAPTVKAKWWADLTGAGTVARSVFWPIPNVDSALVKFVRHSNAGDENLRKMTFAIVDRAFAHRRKMLRVCLSELYGNPAKAIHTLKFAGIDPTLRGEALSLDDFIKIARVRGVEFR